MLNAISRNAKRFRRLTSDILDVTRIKSKSLTLNKERFNLLEVTSDVISDYASQINKSSSGGIRLMLQQSDDAKPIFTEADGNRIIQIISNLLSNAIKFIQDGEAATTTSGIVSVNITTPENTIDSNNNKEVIVSLKDTGNGIDPEILPKLFTKFVANSSGTSLGSFISRSIIEARRGRLWVESNNSKGKNGATFRFSLPFSNDNNVKKMRIMIMIAVKKIEVITKLLNLLGEIDD